MIWKVFYIYTFWDFSDFKSSLQMVLTKVIEEKSDCLERDVYWKGNSDLVFWIKNSFNFWDSWRKIWNMKWRLRNRNVYFVSRLSRIFMSSRCMLLWTPFWDQVTLLIYFFFILMLIFWTPGLLEGVRSNRPCPCICVTVCLSLNISETAH